MRLLHTHTFKLEEFFDASIPPYAILSHTWGKDELLFRDMAFLEETNLFKTSPNPDRRGRPQVLKLFAKGGFAKVVDACALARGQGYDYIWIDTCCIDKSSSAELSEAINSMFRYYRESAVCYAYLSDVAELSQLPASRWFTRGWTLQELIAPRRLELYTTDWALLGEKQDPALLSAISRASRVDEYVLTGAVAPNAVSVAKRMYWASSRTTTRKEDEAYCLMGLFDVNMPLLYGEGEKAFGRLQQEITKITDDQSIFAWYGLWGPVRHRNPGPIKTSCCAPSPRCFALSGNITPLHDMSVSRLLGHIDLTVAYSEFSAIVADETKHAQRRTIILNCQIGPIPGTFPTLMLVEWNDTRHYVREFVSNSVSQLSLYGGPERFSSRYGLAPIGIEVDREQRRAARETEGAAEPAVVVCMGKDGSPRQFPVKRVRTWEKVSTLVANNPVVNPPLVASAVCYRIFWLVPVETPGGQAVADAAAVSISDAFPSQRWDCRSNQVIWGPESAVWTRERGEPITVGVARVSLQPPGGLVMGQEQLNAMTAVVAFGVLRPPTHPPSLYPLWCSLARDDGSLTLAQHFASPPAIGDDADYATLLLDGGVVLHASAVPTEMSRCRYDMISLWASQEAPEDNIDAEMEIEIPPQSRMPSWSISQQREIKPKSKFSELLNPRSQ